MFIFRKRQSIKVVEFGFAHWLLAVIIGAVFSTLGYFNFSEHGMAKLFLAVGVICLIFCLFQKKKTIVFHRSDDEIIVVDNLLLVPFSHRRELKYTADISKISYTETAINSFNRSSEVQAKVFVHFVSGGGFAIGEGRNLTGVSSMNKAQKLSELLGVGFEKSLLIIIAKIKVVKISIKSLFSE